MTCHNSNSASIGTNDKMKQNPRNKVDADQVLSLTRPREDWECNDSTNSDDDDGLNESLSSVGEHDSDDDSAGASVVTAPLTTPCSRPMKKRRVPHVQFSVVQVQEYAVTFGDHPCAEQYPLSLDWEHTAPTIMELTAYEGREKRTPCRRSCELPRPLSITERCLRLSQVAGLSIDELTIKEQQRQDQLEKERLEGLLRDEPEQPLSHDEAIDEEDWNEWSFGIDLDGPGWRSSFLEYELRDCDADEFDIEKSNKLHSVSMNSDPNTTAMQWTANDFAFVLGNGEV